MAVKYQKFEVPTKIKIDDQSDDQTTRIIAEPFERGFGHTIGNALRRILMNSIEAPAIISILIEGVAHEYMAVEGILEDMTHIILNFKRAKLRRLALDGESTARDTVVLKREINITQQMIDDHGGNYELTLGELISDSEFEVVGERQKLFTATAPIKKQISLKVAYGRGYVASERFVDEDKKVDEIYIDACFSPVTKVNYFVEDCRVGRDTELDRVVFDITTDGRVTAQEALSFAKQIAVLHLDVFNELNYQSIVFESEEEEQASENDDLLRKLTLKINEIELSVRSTNCLASAQIETIAELVIMPESEMLKFRNFGKKSLNEIKAKLDDMGLYLGMDLSAYGITRENVKEAVKEIEVEKSE